MHIFYFLILVFGYSNLFGIDYKVDTTNSTVEFKVKHMMFSTVVGSFEKFDGSFSKDETSKQFSNIIGTVEVATISTKSEKRDSFIKSIDFFNVEKYPLMKLKLLEHKSDKMIIQLTIKGITKSIEMDIKDIHESSFELYGEINRKDFQLNFKKLNKIGGIMVGNTIKISLKIKGILTH
jgi:polyisoprenoid-binding protein YceI